MTEVTGEETNLHSTGDHLLTALLSVGGKVEEFVQYYPGLVKSLEDDSWVDGWFLTRVDHFMLDENADPKGVITESCGLA